MHLLIFQYVALGRKGLETPALEIPKEFLETHLKKISQPMCVGFFFEKQSDSQCDKKRSQNGTWELRDVSPPALTNIYSFRLILSQATNFDCKDNGEP